MRTVTVLLLAIGVAVNPAAGQGPIIATVAGGGPHNVPALQTGLGTPQGIAVDSLGNLFLTSGDLHRVFRVDPSGTLTTVAGNGTIGFGGDGGPAVDASLRDPFGIAVDDAGNLYIADSLNNRVRRVDPAGTITTVAGDGSFGSEGDGGPATSASLRNPVGLAVDEEGYLYISESSGHRVRKVSSTGIITTVAGNGSPGFSGDGGPATGASLRNPFGLAVDGAGQIYIADNSNHRVRKVDSGGTITTVAGNGSRTGFSGDGGPATSASLPRPVGLTVDGNGNLYICDHTNLRIRKVDSSGTITTAAGSGLKVFGGDGGPATSAGIGSPLDVYVDAASNLYIADGHLRIRRVDSTSIITTVAGNGSLSFGGDGGAALGASLHQPNRVTLDGDSNLYITDRANLRIRKVDAAAGTISTVAGNGISGFSGDGGPGVNAHLGNPYDVAVDGAGNLFIADETNHRIRRVDPAGIITTIAGTGVSGFSGDGGPATAAHLWGPRGVAVDGAGNLYIADTVNQRVRKVDPAGMITTVAGNGWYGFSGDEGPAVAAQLADPFGVAVDAAGNFYIADLDNQRVRRVNPAGVISTVAGNGVFGFTGDGSLAVGASLRNPFDVAVDGDGNIFIADLANHRVRKVDSAGIISTVAGSGDLGFTGDGGPAVSAALALPSGVAVDGFGNLYIADQLNHRVRKVSVISDVDNDGIPDLDDPCPADPTDQCDPGGSAAGQIDSSTGGQVETSDGNLSLDIAADSLAGDTTVSVTATETQPNDPPADVRLDGGSGQGQIIAEYDFKPDGLSFDPPATLTIVADVTSVSPAFKDGCRDVGDPQFNPNKACQLTIHTRDEATGESIPDPSASCLVQTVGSVDKTTCTVAVSHFSIWAVAAPFDTDGDGIPDLFPPEQDFCPLDPQAASLVEFTGDLLVSTAADGLASVALQGLLSDTANLAIPGEEIVFSMLGEQGTFTPDCPGITSASGVAQCTLDEIPPDLYAVTATFEEVSGCWDGASDEVFLVVFDPDQPRATGGGFFYPDAESTQPGETTGDKANFGFVVYNDQQGSADGNLEFQYRAADINLASQSMEWYTLSNNKAMFQGVGTINGMGTYTFRVHATDGDKMGQPDHFDIVIWAGTDTGSDPIHRAKNELAGGNIVVHKK